MDHRHDGDEDLGCASCVEYMQLSGPGIPTVIAGEPAPDTD